jgi:hypothetical protein
MAHPPDYRPVAGLDQAPEFPVERAAGEYFLGDSPARELEALEPPALGLEIHCSQLKTLSDGKHKPERGFNREVPAANATK